ncbi:hypothetical protein ASG76_13340 [Nocardioides sp. Soil774]|uniref:hypothetical protein n=1 Tax=Nocardioides sp. Soil774 TaxID=1736408 RepID=UPI0006F54D11|nr:hypothetical protein [Nocardioides sp. Soil774]KRE93441.1 hypothetical protein ASG76_13340 [Nocardioides sp. Soil774]
MHSGLWLNDLRNHFREQFHIDVVLFRPDERDAHAWYTQMSDTWLTVSDWTASGTLDTEYSTRFSDSRLTVLIEEEFKEDDPALTRSPLFALSGGSPASSTLSNLVRHAYAGNTMIRVQS